MNNKKNIAVILILTCAIIASFTLPKVKYRSPDILSKLDINYKITDWQGRDIISNVNLDDKRYNFIGNIFARAYANHFGDSLLFLILDAGNFHNPKVCFGSSGWTIKELTDSQFELTGSKKITAKTLFVKKGNEGSLLVYWICINKKVVGWSQQKLIELWYSVLGKQKTGLMLRLEIPITSENKIPKALEFSSDFLKTLSQNISKEESEYIFGE